MFGFATYAVIITDYDIFWVNTKRKNDGGYHLMRDFTGDSFQQANIFVEDRLVKTRYETESISFSINIDGDGDNSRLMRRKAKLINAIFNSSDVTIGIFTPQQGWMTKKILPTRWTGLEYSPYETDSEFSVSIEADVVKGEWASLPLRANTRFAAAGTWTAKMTIPRNSVEVYPKVHFVIRRPTGDIGLTSPNGVTVTLPPAPENATFVTVDLNPKNRGVSFDGLPAPWRDSNFINADFAMKPGTNKLRVDVDAADNGEAECECEVRVATTSRVAL